MSAPATARAPAELAEVCLALLAREPEASRSLLEDILELMSALGRPIEEKVRALASWRGPVEPYLVRTVALMLLDVAEPGWSAKHPNESPKGPRWTIDEIDLPTRDLPDGLEPILARLCGRELAPIPDEELPTVVEYRDGDSDLARLARRWLYQLRAALPTGPR